MDIIWLLIATGLILLVGNAILILIDRKGLYNSVAERLAVTFGLGVGSLSIMQFYLMLAKVAVNKQNLLFLMVPFTIINLYYLKKNKIMPKLRNFNFFKIKEAFKQKAAPLKRIRIWESLCIVFLILLCLIMLFICLGFPMYACDSRATWGFKAKVIFTEKTIFCDDFLDSTRFHPNKPYPLLIPLTESFYYNMLGKIDDYLVKIVFALFYIAFLLFFYISLKKYFETTRLISLLFTSIAASIPCLFVVISGSVPSGYVDFPFSVLFTISIMYLFYYFRNRQIEHLVIACLFAVFYLFTKNEGMPFFLFSIIVFLSDAFIGKYFDKKTIKHFLFFVFLALIILLPWFIIKSKMPRVEYNNPLPYLTLENFRDKYPYLGKVLKLTLKQFFLTFSSWGIFWYLVVISFFVNSGKNIRLYFPRIEAYLFIIPFVYYFFVLTPIYVMFYTATYPVPLEVEFATGSFERLHLQVFPLFIFFVALRFRRWITG